MKKPLLQPLRNGLPTSFRLVTRRIPLALSLITVVCILTVALTGAIERDTAPIDIGLTRIQPSPFRRQIERNGVVEPFHSTIVRSDCFWKTQILNLVPEGTWVQKGDVVCELDSSEIEEFARSREILLIKYRGRLDSALHDEDMLSAQSERLLAAAEYKFQTADQELSEYQLGTLPQQLGEMERNLSLLSDQTVAAADDVHHNERLWSMGVMNRQELFKSSLALFDRQQKHDQLQSKLNLLINFTNGRNNLRLEHGRNNALQNVARTTIRNSLAQTNARLTSLAFQRTVRIYETYYHRAVDSIKACTLRAPCDGQVLHGNSWYLRSRGITQIEVGATVRQLQRVFEIPDLNRLKVSVPIDEALIYSIEHGMPVTVHPVGYEDMEIAGRISTIAKYPRARSSYTPDVKDYWLDVEVLPTPEQAKVLTLKADVSVMITLFEKSDALQVPRNAVTGVAGQNFVYVFDGTEMLPRRVELGEANAESVCVVSGLSAGDQLVTEMTLQHREKLEAKLAADPGAAIP